MRTGPKSSGGRLARHIGWGRMLALVVLAGFVALRVWDPTALQLLRLKTFDLYQLAKPRAASARPVAIVDIDEASLQAYGQWPWPRTLIARLVDGIARGGAVAIAFDVVFPEPDRTSPALLAQAMPDLSQSARLELAQAKSHDAVLAEAIKRARVVLGQSAFNPRAGQARAEPARQAPIATLGGDPKPHLLHFPALLTNIAELEAAAAGRGMFTIRPDPDGVVRRIPMVLVADDVIVPALSADLLRVATGQSALLVKSDGNGVTGVVIAGAQIPTDSAAQLWIHFGPHDPDRFVSAMDILQGRKLDRLARKLVLVGTSASGLLDLKATPVAPAMPGVEVHAQAIENILTQASLLRPGYTVGAEVSLALLFGLACAILAPIMGALPVLALGLAIAAALAGGSWYLFTSHNVLLDIGYPLLSSAAVFLVLVFTNYAREEAQRRQIRGAFGQYLAPAMVEQLARDPDRLVLGGETREMTVLFSDVRGFTAISESYKSNPQGLTALMNQFLTPLSNAILQSGGTIDKYMGDAIMAFWNAPLDDREHARHACAAALEMGTRLEGVNAERKAETESGGMFTPLRVGIGINTGLCVVGNMGSDQRFDYTVMGDTVNLASRLEGRTRTYGAAIIVGSATVARAGEGFALLEIDTVRVKGKTEPESIYALLGGEEVAADPQFQALREAIGAARDAYRQSDWDTARNGFAACRERANGVGLGPTLDLYETRIAAFAKAPPPSDWDGVETLDTK